MYSEYVKQYVVMVIRDIVEKCTRVSMEVERKTANAMARVD